jgi:hypothetical protein
MGNIGVGVPEGVPEGVPDGSVGPGFEVALSCHQYCTKCYLFVHSSLSPPLSPLTSLIPELEHI